MGFCAHYTEILYRNFWTIDGSDSFNPSYLPYSIYLHTVIEIVIHGRDCITILLDRHVPFQSLRRINVIICGGHSLLVFYDIYVIICPNGRMLE